MQPAARRLLASLVIGALGAFANPAAAQLTEAQRAEIEGMRAGDMTKLLIHKTPRDRVEVGFTDGLGAPTDLGAFAGTVTLLNLWATWCPPCVHEMPALNRLAQALEGSGARVVTLNVERNGRVKAEDFMRRMTLFALEPYADEPGAFPRAVGVLGLPTTLVLDPQGREIARLQGDAAWDEDPAPAILRRLAEMTGADG